MNSSEKILEERDNWVGKCWLNLNICLTFMVNFFKNMKI